MAKRIPKETVECLRDIVMTVVSGIVDHADSVEVNIVPSSYRLLVELHTDANDVGQVIGANGHVAIGLRSILLAFGGKHGIKVGFDFVTEHERDSDRRANAR